MESSILVKTFALLEATAGHPTPKSLGELASSVGLSKPTAHRILKTLNALGYVERSRGGQYRQTGQVQRLVTGADHRRLLQVSNPLLRRLHASTRETINLGVLRQDKIVYLRVLESTMPLRRVAEPNSTDPFYCTALGRSIVAFLPSEHRDLLLRNVRPQQHTAATVTDVDELRNIFAQVSREGFSIEKDQTDLGVTCIGVPIFAENAPIAAVSLSIPSVRSNEKYEKDLIFAVRAVADEVTKQLTKAQEAAR